MEVFRSLASGLAVFAIVTSTGMVGDAFALMRRRSAPDSPEEAATPYARAETAADAGDCAAALPLLDEVLADAPDDADALALRGYCLRKGGRLEEALASYRRALEIRPEFPAARQYLGEAHLQAVVREAEILRGYGESGREELRVLLEALREVTDDQARRGIPGGNPADAPEGRW